MGQYCQRQCGKLKVEDLQEIAVAPRFDRDQLRYLRTTVLHTDVELESRRQLVACPLLRVCSCEVPTEAAT